MVQELGKDFIKVKKSLRPNEDRKTIRKFAHSLEVTWGLASEIMSSGDAYNTRLHYKWFSSFDVPVDFQIGVSRLELPLDMKVSNSNEVPAFMYITATLISNHVAVSRFVYCLCSPLLVYIPFFAAWLASFIFFIMY